MNGYDVQNPVIGRNQDGRLEIFAWAWNGSGTWDNAVYRRNQTAVNGTSWAAWASLGTWSGGTRWPAVATNPAGQMELFAQSEHVQLGTCGGFYNQIVRIYQTSPNSGWSSWIDMDHPTCNSLYNPHVGVNSDGRLDMLAVADDGNLYHRWELTSGGSWTSNWTSLGAPSGLSTSMLMAIGNNADGRIALFIKASNNEIYHLWQDTASNLSIWSSWTGFGKPPVTSLSDPALGQNQDGRLEVFVVGSDGKLYHKWQVAPNSYWSSSWTGLGMPSTASLVGRARISRTSDGRLVAFAVANDGALWSLAQTQANGTWGSWTSLGKPSGSSLDSIPDLAVAQNKNGTLVIAAVDTNGNLWWNTQQSFVFLPLTLR